MNYDWLDKAAILSMILGFLLYVGTVVAVVYVVVHFISKYW